MAPHLSNILPSLRSIAASSGAALVVLGCSAVTANPSSGSVLPPWDASATNGQDEASGTWDAASACRPGNLQTYYPKAYRPAAPVPGACRTQAAGDPIQLFYDDCLGPNASTGLCDAFKANKAYAACADCILTPATALQYGALVGHDNFISANVAGCVELTEPAGLPCAKAIQALSDCELAACEANCPVSDSATFAAYSACASDADKAGCSAYVSAAACPQVSTGADSSARPCLAQSFTDFYRAVAPLFCGPSPPSATDVDASAASRDGSGGAARD